MTLDVFDRDKWKRDIQPDPAKCCYGACGAPTTGEFFGFRYCAAHLAERREQDRWDRYCDHMDEARSERHSWRMEHEAEEREPDADGED